MNIARLLAQLADLSPDTLQQAAPRRQALTRLGQAGATLLPAVLAALPQAATAAPQDSRTRLDVLTLGLTLEYLESELYSRALSLPNVDAFVGSAQHKAALQTMLTHENQHVTLLRRFISDAGGTVPTKPNFDFTGSRNGAQAALYPDVFTNFDTFLRVAQLVEDAGVRAYKGQLEFLQTNKQQPETLPFNYLVDAVVRTHSVEARHAAQIRTMRRQRGATVKSWVSPSDAPITTTGTVPNAVYAGEGNINQYLPGPQLVPFSTTLPINVATPPLSTEAILAKVAEAFDEPVEAATAISLVQLFTY